LKTFILGLDGLEYALVKKWGMENLKQKECGKLKVPANRKSGHPFTPEVWGAFLTGQENTQNMEEERHPLVISLKVLTFLRRYVPLKLGLGAKIRRKLPFRQWGALMYGIPQDASTFIDLTYSKTINVPFYDNDCAAFKIMEQFDMGKVSLQEVVSSYQELYNERRKMILDKIKDTLDFDLVFAYLHFPDMLEHFAFNQLSIIKKHYRSLNCFVLKLKEIIGDSPLFLIVSDHGFDLEVGYHSKYGFYSSNKPLNPKPKRITDFFSWFVE